ncbi:hypothetical protein [Kordiimonas marina]|uniref:hypothetical protein n=1 Tax=Kordiimonas marina TaxID=2872312 RepID=UPI001FF1F023|nr:hypothetical protein [Kordiimonas marina]MCJ9428566.1 hypothetical protein [Kordiimonas marina]
MALEDIKPTTIEGIKRLAKQLKKAEGLKHTDALNRAARQAGYADFAQAAQAHSEKG